jgi:DUF1680 family protein
MEPIWARINGGFWHVYRTLVRERVLPYQWKAMNDEIPSAPKSNSVQNFRIAAGLARRSHEGMVFQDSDLAKWLEAVGYVLRDDSEGAPAVKEHAREAVDLIASAQQPDGYVNTYFTAREPGRRWTNLRDAHELYCAGHLIEAGVSMFRGGGDGKLLDVVRRLADLIDVTFGVEEGKIRGYPGHEEVELALMKLYRLTGEHRYLQRARYFIDERGRTPNFFEREATAPGFVSIFGAKPLDYYQAHLPVREQSEATGHAVRAMYLYTAMADLVLETGDPSLGEACDRLWESTTDRKMYVTGGIGASAVRESFSADFDLPNDTAYAETCAAIGLFLFASRMVRIHHEARYAEVMERCLYNGIISGISLDGESYFYVNPLEVVPAVCDHNGTYQSVKYRRQPWYGCACCPPNVARLLAALGEYMYHLQGDTLYADLYHEGILSAELAGAPVTVTQKTGYPCSDTITFDVEPASPAEFTLALRVPAWCRKPALSINERPAAASAGADGYARVRRTWRKSDRLQLTLPMTAMRIYADPRVRADYGKAAIQRGPLIYCLEEVDNGPALFRVRLPSNAPLSVVERPDLLGGIVAVTATGKSPPPGSSGDGLYSERNSDLSLVDRPLLFIPYYAWANRAPGEMLVWVRE